jgi:hypothetical protein
VINEAVSGVGVIERALDTRGLRHHAMGQGSPCSEERSHDLVACLGHPRHRVERQLRVDGLDEPPHGERTFHFDHRPQVFVQRRTQLVEGSAGAGGPLDLTAGFE